MSRLAKKPIIIPAGVEVSMSDGQVQVKGSKGVLSHQLHHLIKVNHQDDELMCSAVNESKAAKAQLGTATAILRNLVIGVSQGFEKKLQLVGVGYRAKVQGNSINLVLGFSHGIDHKLPEGITAETPSQTEIVLKGIDKQLVGQVASDIRQYRPPEPYKGKGVRYADEHISLKEAKKK